MSMPTWKRYDKRSYVYQTKHVTAFVFGCSRPVQLWAWVAFWSSGKAGGVEQGFRKAQDQASDCIMQIEMRWHHADKTPSVGSEADKLKKQNARMAALSALFGAKIS